MIPSKTYRYTLHKGLTGHDVWALQINLNARFGNRQVPLVEDGVYGPTTAGRVYLFQSNNNLVKDGVAGAVTQRTLARLMARPHEKAQGLPKGLLDGLIEGESGWMVGAVSWLVAGGVDCGWIQRRVLDSNFSTAAFHKAFNADVQFPLVAKDLRETKDQFRKLPGATTERRAWELAILSHNWPAGANQLAHGTPLSTKPAAWVEQIGVSGVSTPAQWANFYISSKTSYVQW